VHLLLSIVDPIPALHQVAAVLDVLIVEPLIIILAIIVRSPVTVGRTSILLLLLLRLIRFVKVHRDLLLLRRVVTRKTTCGFRGRALGDPTTTHAHLPVRSGAPGYPPRAVLTVQPLEEDGDDVDNDNYYISYYYSVLHFASPCRSPKTIIVVQGTPHTFILDTGPEVSIVPRTFINNTYAVNQMLIHIL